MRLMPRANAVLMPQPKFSAPLKKNLGPSIGNVTPTFTRNSIATVIDHSGVVSTCLANEARFNGMRRVENLAPLSTTTSMFSIAVAVTLGTGATQYKTGHTATTVTKSSVSAGARAQRNITGVTGKMYLATMRVLKPLSSTGDFCALVEGATMAHTVFNPFTGAVTYTTGFTNSWVITDPDNPAWWRIGFLIAPGVTVAPAFYPAWNSDGSANESTAIGSGYTYTVDGLQIEDVTGQLVQTPGEYVCKGIGGPNYGPELGILPYVARGTVTGSGTYVATTTSVVTTQYGIVAALPTGALVAGKTYRIYAKLNSRSVVDPTHQLSICDSADQNSGIIAQQLVISNTSGASIIYVASATRTLTLRSDTGTATIGDSWNFTFSVTECLFSGANVDGVQYFDTQLDGRPIYEAYGPEMCINGTFDTNANGWTFANNSGDVSNPAIGAVSGGILTVTGAQTPRVSQTFNLLSGKTYEVSVDIISATSAPFLSFSTGVQDLTSNLANDVSSNVTGRRTFSWTSTVTGQLGVGLRSTTAGSFTIDNFSLRERKPLAGLGVDQINDGNFGNRSLYWVLSGQTSIANGKATIASTGAAATVGQTPATMSASKTYLVSFTAVVRSGTAKLQDSGGGILVNIATSGNYSGYLTNTQSVIFNRISACDVDISNVSVREVLLPAGYLNEPSRANLLGYPADISNAAWVENSSTSSAGTQYATFKSMLVASGGAIWNRRNQAITLSASTYSISVYYKLGTSALAYVCLYLDGTHISDGSFSATGALTSSANPGVTVVSAWKSVKISPDVFMATATLTLTAAGTYYLGCGPSSATVGQTIEFLGAQIELASTPSSFIPQTITRAADILSYPQPVAVGGTNLLLYSNFPGAAGAPGTTPTQWGVTGGSGTCMQLTAETAINSACQVVKLRKIVSGNGYEGIQRYNSVDGITTGIAYTFSIYVRVPTGVTACYLIFYSGGGNPGVATIANAATLNAQPKDVFVRYSVNITFTVAPVSLAFAMTSATAVGQGFDITCPMINTGSTAGIYPSFTYSANGASNTPSAYGMILEGGSGSATSGISLGVGSTTAQACIDVRSGNLVQNEAITAVWDGRVNKFAAGSSGSMSFNGVTVTSNGTPAGTIQPSTLYVGQRYNNTLNFQGVITDINVYGTPLTQAVNNRLTT